MFRSGAAIRGAKAKHIGQLFESIIASHCAKASIKFEQIPSGCKWIGKRPIAVKTPFDFIAATNGKTLLFDAKTVDSNSFSFSALKEHQVESLFGFESCGIKAGYVVWFRPSDSVVFFSASSLKSLQRRGSLKASNGVFLGGKNTLDLRSLFHG